MVIQRDKYIEALISKRWNGKVKIITGIRRCGKSFLLLTLLVSYLFIGRVHYTTRLTFKIIPSQLQAWDFVCILD